MKGLKGTGKGGKITLEQYVDFFENLDRPDLTIEQLNQIIFMHGFVRMHRRLKVDIVNTLNAMELVQPTRSTLQETITGCAALTVDEVARDLDAIGWQECPIGSIQSAGSPSASAVEDVVPISSTTAEISCSATSSTAASEKKKKARMARKRKRGSAVPLLTLGPC